MDYESELCLQLFDLNRRVDEEYVDLYDVPITLIVYFKYDPVYLNGFLIKAPPI